MPPLRLAEIAASFLPLTLSVLLPLHASAAETAPPLPLAATSDMQSLAGHVDLLVDPSFALTFEDVARAPNDAFASIGPGHFARDVQVIGAFWLRFQLQNNSDAPLDRVVELSFGLIDHLTAYVPQVGGGFVAHEAGEDTPHHRRMVNNYLPRFPVTVPAGGTATFYFRVVDEGSATAPIAVATWLGISDMEAKRQFVAAASMAIMALVLLLVLLVMMSRRQWTGVLAFSASTMGAVLAFYATYTWGEVGALLEGAQRGHWVNRIIMVEMYLMGWSLVQLTRALVSTRVHHPRLDRVMQAVAWYIALCAVLLFVLDYMTMVRQIPLYFLGLVVSLAPVTVLRAFAGDRSARYMGAGFVALILTTLPGALRGQGLLSESMLTEHGLAAGLGIFIVLMGLAVADRMSVQRREREEALRERLLEAERNAALSRVFELFVPKAFVERIGHTEITDIALGQCSRIHMTVLFSDIRSFTSIVEKLTPDENFAFINDYLGYMEPAVHRHGGFIDKYIGDAVMALFDDQHPGEMAGQHGAHGAGQGVASAVAMFQALARYNQVRQGRGEAPIDIGVGLHTGELMLGMLGGADRLNATVIGDAVNLAARVEGMTKAYGAKVLVTDATRAALPQAAPWTLRPVERAVVKGKAEAVTVYEVLDALSEAAMADRLASLPVWTRAWDAWLAGELQTATETLEGLVAAHPDDKLYSVHLTRCQEWARVGLPDGWDGVVWLTGK